MMLFSRNHQENHKKSASYQQISLKTVIYNPIIASSHTVSTFLQAVPARTTWRRALMPRQPYSAAVPSTGGRLHPSLFEKGRLG